MKRFFYVIEKFLLIYLLFICALVIIATDLTVSAESDISKQYAIYSLKIGQSEDISAEVCLFAEDDCSLIVALYGEHGNLITANQCSITASNEKQEITFLISEEEKEFSYAQGFLLNIVSCEPLCDNSLSFVADTKNVWECNGSSYYDAQEQQYVLVPDYQTWSVGAIWFGEQLQDDFTVDMDYYTGSTNRSLNGGDGMVVAFYANKDYSMQPVLGFDGCMGYGVELDTWSNSNCGDPSYNHIALIKNNISNHLSFAQLPESKDEKWHHFKMVVKDNICKVYIDGMLKISETVNSTGYGCLGITTGTGDAVNLHAVKNILVTY